MKIVTGTALLTLMSLTLSAIDDGWSNANPQRFGSIDTAQSIWHEDFSSPEVPYTVEFCGGAKGKVEVLKRGGRNNSPALRTVKSNDSGYIVIRFKKDVPVNAGDKLQLNCFYRGERSTVPYSKALLRLQAPGQKDYKLFTFYPGINGGELLQQIVSAPQNTWERKFTHRKGENGVKAFQPTLVIAGHASEAVWDDFYIEKYSVAEAKWAKSLGRYAPVDHSGQMISKEQLQKIIEKMPERTGKVVSIDGKSRLLVDGKITAPIINGPYGKFVAGKNYSNAAGFAAAGVHLVRVQLRLGQGRNAKIYPGFWTGKDQFNLAGAVEQISNTLRLDPEARIILSIMLHPYWEFTKDFPGEAWVGSKGFPLVGHGIHLAEAQRKEIKTGDEYIWPSHQSEILNNLYKKQIAKLLGELRRTGYLKAVVGIHIGGGHDNQLVVSHFDYSAPAIKAFRQYLREIYPNEEALRKAWNNPAVTFDTAEAPTFPKNVDCINPKTERNCIDFYRFSKVAPWRRAGEIADYVKQIIGKDVFTIRWGQNPYNGVPGTSPAVNDFLAHQKFDIMVEQADYVRRPPSTSCTPRVPIESFHLHGKIFVNEFDLRTWCATPSWEKEIMSVTWGLILDPPMWRSVNRKLAGSMFANDMGFWYLDMAPGWFENPDILADIKTTAAAGNMLANEKPVKWKKDTALVVDDDGYFLRNLPGPQWMFDISSLLETELLGLSGVPYAFYTLNDFLSNPELARDFKVIVFAGMYEIDAKRLTLINSLKNSNRTLIFLSGSGRLGGAGEAFGMEIKYDGHKINHNVINEPGVKHDFTSAWMNSRLPSLLCQPKWFEYIPVVYAVPAANDKILARFDVNKKPAVVEHTGDKWKAVYIGESGGLTPAYFNYLVREAGAYAPTESGYQCETNGNFFSLHSMKNGPVSIRLPFRADVTNLYNGKKTMNVTSLTLNAEAGATYWFKLTPVK